MVFLNTEVFCGCAVYRGLPNFWRPWYIYIPVYTFFFFFFLLVQTISSQRGKTTPSCPYFTSALANFQKVREDIIINLFVFRGAKRWTNGILVFKSLFYYFVYLVSLNRIDFFRLHLLFVWDRMIYINIYMWYWRYIYIYNVCTGILINNNNNKFYLKKKKGRVSSRNRIGHDDGL